MLERKTVDSKIERRKMELANWDQLEKSTEFLGGKFWGFPKCDLHVLLLVPEVGDDPLDPDEEFLSDAGLAVLLQGGPHALELLITHS